MLLTSTKRDKGWAALTGIASLLLLLSGFAMMHGGGYSLRQPWVLGMVIIWIMLSGMGHMVSKALAEKGQNRLPWHVSPGHCGSWLRDFSLLSLSCC